MGRPVTLCTCQWADLPFDELCVLAKKMGYDGLEVACWGNGIDIDRALTDDAYVESARQAIEEVMHFDNVYNTNASCTIASHCGPNTLGILFMTE